MFLKIDHSSGVPIYRQIMEQIKYSIAKGGLAPGERLPAIRQLSLDLKVNPNTIIKAYSELEHEQVILTKRGMGTFVSDKKIEITRSEKVETVTLLTERLAVEAIQLDMSKADLLRIVTKILTRFYSGEGKGAKR